MALRGGVQGTFSVFYPGSGDPGVWLTVHTFRVEGAPPRDPFPIPRDLAGRSTGPLTSLVLRPTSRGLMASGKSINTFFIYPPPPSYPKVFVYAGTRGFGTPGSPAETKGCDGDEGKPSNGEGEGVVWVRSIVSQVVWVNCLPF